ncbi:MAG TPA: trypsin-like serine protease [Polyangiaceae bacterium]
MLTPNEPTRAPFTVGLAIAAFFSLAGCGADFDASEPDALFDAPATSSQAITGGGTVGTGPGVVQIEYVIPGVGTSWCSGVVIGPHVALTAGHCWDSALGFEDHGWASVKIHSTTNGTDWRCVTRSRNGRCLVFDSVWVNRLAPPPPRDIIAPELDFAVLTTNIAFANVPSFPHVWVDQRVGDTVRQYGVGIEGTVLRFYDDKYDWVGSNHMVIDAGNTRNCSGDSGGPQIWSRFGFDWLTGLYVGSNAQFDSVCNSPGHKQRAHRITRARIDWMNLATAWVRDAGQPECVNMAIRNDREAGFRCF